MKTTTINCDKCGSSKIGGPDITFHFPEYSISGYDIRYDIRAKAVKNVLDPHGDNTPIDLDICFKCKTDLIIEWGEIMKKRASR